MKKTAALMISMIATIVLFADQPGVAPLNPAFVKYMEAKESGKLNKRTSDGNTLGYIPPPVQRSENFKPVATDPKLPTVYDLRAQGYMTGVRNQLTCGSCWTFATYANIESRRLVQGQGTWDFSENNLKQHHGFVWGPCDGGNGSMSTAYLTRGDGAILEADDPYSASDSDNWNSNPPVMYIYDAVYLPDDINAIKQAIYDYGAVYTSMYWGDPYYNSTNKTYYYNGTADLNHAVTLAGWDDTKSTSGGTGAWIIKNSWGSSWGESGYFYISYNDTKVNSEVWYWPEKLDYDNTREINYHDYFGELGYSGYGNPTGYALVKFVPSTNHTITKLGTYMYNDGTTVGFEVYDTYSGGSLSNQLGTIPNSVQTRSGYKSFDLPTPISVTAGNDIYVKVYYNTPGYNYPIPIEQTIGGYASPTIETGVFSISSSGANGTWFQVGGGTSYLWDPCVKTYGAPDDLDTPQNLTTSIDAQSMIISWDAVPGAGSYAVYCSDDPYGTYVIDTNGMLSGTSWITPMLTAKKFYYVKALSEKTKVYNEIKVSHEEE